MCQRFSFLTVFRDFIDYSWVDLQVKKVISISFYYERYYSTPINLFAITILRKSKFVKENFSIDPMFVLICSRDRVPVWKRTTSKDAGGRSAVPSQGRGAKQNSDRRLPRRKVGVQWSGAPGFRRTTRLHWSNTSPGSQVSLKKK